MLKISDARWDRIKHHFPEENIPDERPGRKPIPARRVFLGFVQVSAAVLLLRQI